MGVGEAEKALRKGEVSGEEGSDAGVLVSLWRGGGSGGGERRPTRRDVRVTRETESIPLV